MDVLRETVEAILKELDVKAVVRGDRVELVADSCGTCRYLPANGGSCDDGYSVWPSCTEWEYGERNA